MERPRLITAALLAVVAFGFLFLSVRSARVADDGQTAAAPLPPAQVKHAPDFSLPDAASGQIVRLSEQTKLGPVVFAFWATWCGPCHDELPHLEQVSRRYKGRVAFYGINSDDPPAAVLHYAFQNSLTFPMLSDAARQAATRYGVDAIPMLVVVDTKGNARAVTVGYDPSENLETVLPKLLDTLLAGH